MRYILTKTAVPIPWNSFILYYPLVLIMLVLLNYSRQHFASKDSVKTAENSSHVAVQRPAVYAEDADRGSLLSPDCVIVKKIITAAAYNCYY